MRKLKYFDSSWYLSQYPDVAAAGIDPREHFEKHGRREGRLPCFLPSIAIEKSLWANAHRPRFFLKALNCAVKQGGFDGIYASKVLADFHLFVGAYDEAIKAICYLIEHQTSAEELFDLNELFLLQFSSFFLNDDIAKASALLTNKRWIENSSKLLAMEMLSGESNRLVSLNRLFKVNGLSQVTLNNRSSLLDSLCASKPKAGLITRAFSLLKPATVSVVIPCYNAGRTIATCLKSLKSQTWPDIEIIVVDDASTDNSLIELTRLKAEINGLKVVSSKSNRGAYATRNLGMSIATGDFLTVMDADDWAHPQKIEKQVTPLLFNRSLKGTVSHWARCTEDLKFSRLRAGNSWVHRNVSSLLVRKDVVAKLGGWDEVKVNADTEFYERCLAKFGQAAIKEVMQIGRASCRERVYAPG